MASAYKRDDKQFREQVRKMADVGLNLDRTNEPYPSNHPCHKVAMNGITMPERSKGVEILCGLLAYFVLGIAIALLFVYFVIPAWSAL